MWLWDGKWISTLEGTACDKIKDDQEKGLQVYVDLYVHILL